MRHQNRIRLDATWLLQSFTFRNKTFHAMLTVNEGAVISKVFQKILSPKISPNFTTSACCASHLFFQAYMQPTCAPLQIAVCSPSQLPCEFTRNYHLRRFSNTITRNYNTNVLQLLQTGDSIQVIPTTLCNLPLRVEKLPVRTSLFVTKSAITTVQLPDYSLLNSEGNMEVSIKRGTQYRAQSTTFLTMGTQLHNF